MPFRLLPLLLVATLPAHPFDPARDIAMSVVHARLIVAIPAGVHLKANRFTVTLASGPGRLEVGPLPPAQARDDAGDPIWRGTVEVPLRAKGLADPAAFRIGFQPCTEGPDAVCYLPQHRTLAVAAGSLRP
ncbi:MAG TPA: hypothetical protein VF768_10660 [Holophagaceae bacterium]